MELVPAIDLRRGDVVRLRRGLDGERSVYAADPVTTLRELVRAGVRRVQVVDLDAAFGEPPQRELIARLLASRERSALQIAGGLRSRESVTWALESGAERAVVGSLAALDPYAFCELAELFPLRLVPALDIEHGKVRIAGWTGDAQLSVAEMCDGLRGLPCAAIMVTDISREGALSGASIRLARDVSRASQLPALLSGGIGTLQDLRAAARVPEIVGAVVGKALWESTFSLGEALAACYPEVDE